MATSFAALKKSRSSSLSKLVTETAKINAPSEGSNEDNRFWTPSVDKAQKQETTDCRIPLDVIKGVKEAPLSANSITTRIERDEKCVPGVRREEGT